MGIEQRKHQNNSSIQSYEMISVTGHLPALCTATLLVCVIAIMTTFALP